MSLEALSLSEAASAIRAGRLSPVDYAAALLDWIDRVEPAIEAWVTIDRAAVLSEARLLETEALRHEFRGPLHGLPIGVKDIFYTKGLRTTMGSAVFKDFIPDRDADAVANLKKAGALILGKTVTTVFAYLDPGPTRNPWNARHTPGGSSSGSAAAVAARMCPAAIGSQTVGSLGRPAAFCGVASLMPAQQRMSLKRVFPLAWSLDHVGFFARSAADLELMLDALSQSPDSSASPADAVRIGLVREFFEDKCTPEARSLHDDLAARLSSGGFHVSEAPLPAIFGIHQPILRTMLRAETASVHEKLFAEQPQAYGTKLRALIETGKLVEGPDYLRARRLRRIYQREMARLFDDFDVLMTPAARGAAPEGIGATGDAVMNGPWTLADFPTMTVPHAVTAAGLPVGVQLTGPPLEERRLLQIGKRVEAAIGFNASPPV